MHRNSSVRVLLLTSASVWVSVAATSRSAVDLLAHQPVHFEPSTDTRFVARGLNYEFLISGNRADVRTQNGSVRVQFDGGRNAPLEGVDRLASATNIIRGNDPSKWRRDIPNFSRVLARNVYPGIDVVYYGSDGRLEYDLILHPGADPKQIRLRMNDSAARVDGDGNWSGAIVHNKPVTYQLTPDGKRTQVDSRFHRNGDGSFGFDIGKFDSDRSLVIDPTLSVSAYLAGTYQDIGMSVGHDSQGFVYVGGITYSTDLPVTDSSYDTTAAGAYDLFVAKIDPNGSRVIYMTYVGGAGVDKLNDMVVDSVGKVYLAGSTTSTDFPLGNAAVSALAGKTDGFVLVLDVGQAGTAALFYGTFLGGTEDDFCNGIALDSRGRILVTGQTFSTGFPTAGGYQTTSTSTSEAFVSVIDTTQAGTGTLVYSTYLGGTNWDAGRGIAAAPDGTVWVTGASYSGDFPMAGLSHQPNYQGGGDAFVAQINPNVAGSSSLLYSTYVGATGTDEANRIFVDRNGRVIIAGFTLSNDLPVTSTAIQRQLAGQADVFLAIIVPSTSGNPAQQLVYLSYFGGQGGDEAYALTGDAAGNIYVAGLTKSDNFPTTSDAFQKSLPGGPGGFLLKFTTTKATPDYSTYIATDGNQTTYGIDVDAGGTMYLTGFASGPLLDSLNGAVKTTDPGNSDAFLIGLRP